jgi:hypothetical protein
MSGKSGTIIAHWKTAGPSQDDATIPDAGALSVFDEECYLDTNEDVAAVARDLRPAVARAHYAHHGFPERRLPFRLDPVWYAGQYPLAALEVAQGDYAEFAYHYLAIGKVRGYRPYPPEDEI